MSLTMDALSTAKLDRETTKRIDEWLNSVRGRAVGNKRRQIYHYDIPLEWLSREQTCDINTVDIQSEEMMVLEIPVRELASMSETQEWYRQNIGGFSMGRFDKMIRDKHSEEYLRKNNEGLQDAWEKYQIMLALCSDKTFK